MQHYSEKGLAGLNEHQTKASGNAVLLREEIMFNKQLQVI
jgi:hypothetical protein